MLNLGNGSTGTGYSMGGRPWPHAAPKNASGAATASHKNARAMAACTGTAAELPAACNARFAAAKPVNAKPGKPMATSSPGGTHGTRNSWLTRLTNPAPGDDDEIDNGASKEPLVVEAPLVPVRSVGEVSVRCIRPATYPPAPANTQKKQRAATKKLPRLAGLRYPNI